MAVKSLELYRSSVINPHWLLPIDALLIELLIAYHIPHCTVQVTVGVKLKTGKAIKGNLIITYLHSPSLTRCKALHPNTTACRNAHRTTRELLFLLPGGTHTHDIDEDSDSHPCSTDTDSKSDTSIATDASCNVCVEYKRSSQIVRKANASEIDRQVAALVCF